MVIPYYREVRRCENEAPKKSRYKCAVKTSGFSLVKHQNGIDGPTKKCSLAIVVFIAQLVRALHRNLKGHGFHSRWSLKVFSDSLCVNKLDDMTSYIASGTNFVSIIVAFGALNILVLVKWKIIFRVASLRTTQTISKISWIIWSFFCIAE